MGVSSDLQFSKLSEVKGNGGPFFFFFFSSTSLLSLRMVSSDDGPLTGVIWKLIVSFSLSVTLLSFGDDGFSAGILKRRVDSFCRLLGVGCCGGMQRVFFSRRTSSPVC